MLPLWREHNFGGLELKKWVFGVCPALGTERFWAKKRQKTIKTKKNEKTIEKITKKIENTSKKRCFGVGGLPFQDPLL